MMDEYIPYYHDMWTMVDKPLRPTGRWKLVSGLTDNNTLFIEHQGFLFRRWVSEHLILFGPAPRETVFNCSKTGEQP